MTLSQSKNQIDNYKLIYSPRTTYNTQKNIEKRLYNDLLQSFDPFTLKILRRHFKEHLGSISKDLFICILKRHLLSWNPKVKNREKIFIKLLSQLFDEIDLDSDDIINWNEFSNFLVYIGNSRKSENSFYHLRQYFKCKTNFDHAEKPDIDDDRIRYMNINNNENVSYCFYIAKYRILGLIHEGKNKIIFFNTENKKRLKLEIDLLSIQDQIDKYEIYEFENKTEAMLQKKEEQKLIHKAQLEEKCKKLFLKLNRKFKSDTNKININNNNSSSSENQNSQNLSNNNDNSSNNNKKRVSTPNAKKQLKKINLKKNLPSLPKYINIKTEGNIKRTEKKTYHIVNTLFLDNYNLLFISSTNNIISAWKFKEKEEYFENVNLISQNIEDPHNKKECIFEKNEILIPLFTTEHTQYAMCFDYVTNNLYTGQTDGKILKWDMTINKPILILDINEFNKNDIILPKLNTNYHNQTKDILLKIGQGELNKILKSFPENKRNTVSCLIFIDPLKLLCSAHYNGQIILWDIIYNKPKRIFNDQKTGIYQLLYDYNTNHIYSCGFEHDIFIYDPYIDNEAVYRLKGHKSSVNSIALIQENQELLSIDILGKIKIWDTRNLYNFQSININDSTLLEVNHLRSREELNDRSRKKKISANHHIQPFPDLKKFLIYGEKFLLYEKGNFINALLCDDYMILGSFYNPITNKIITISNKNIKFWNILNGQLVRIYSELMNNENEKENKNTIKNNEYEITSFEYDTLYKKIYLGDSLGRIKSFYLSTGDFMKEFQPHKSEITHIIYSNKYDYLITCSNDLKVKFHKDNEAKDNNYKVIREMKLLPDKKKINTENRKINLIRIVFDEEKGILLSCLSNGLIIEFDVEHFKVISEIETIRDFMSLDNLKNIPQVTAAEYIKDALMFFIASDNKYRKLVILKSNKYYNILKQQYIGNFKDDNNIIDNMNNTENYSAFKKYAIMCSFYDIKTRKLFLGDSFGFLMCYDLSCLFDNLMNNDLLSLNDDVLNAAKNNINFPIVFKIELNKEPITHIDKPEKLIPNILIVSSVDRTVKLVNYNTGEHIDSLKQNSINNKAFPIAVRYCIDNPFEKKSPIDHKEENKTIENDNNNAEDNNNNDEKKKYNNTLSDINEEEKEKKNDESNNKYTTISYINDVENDEEEKELYPNIMYRKNVKHEQEIPKIKKHEDRKKELVRYSNAILLYSVKEKMKIPKYSEEIPENKSTLWKYEVDVEYLKRIDDEQISNIARKIGNKEKEINITETNFQKYSVNAKNYLPKYIKDLSQNEKDKIKESISNKIKDVNLAFNKKAKIQREMEDISKIEKKNIHTNSSVNKDLLFINKKNELSNFFLTPLKPIKTKSVTNKKKKEGSKLPPLIEENSRNNSPDDKKVKKQINTNKSYKKLSYNIKIVQSPKKYHFIGNIFKNYSVSNEEKFKEYKNQFDEKINEIMGPIEFIKLRKNKFNGINGILK
jgi:hypothetical protein